MKKSIFLLALLIIYIDSIAQKIDTASKKDQQTTTLNAADSLLNSIGSDDKKTPVIIFKSSRLILSQSSETVKKNNLNFLVIHRFGDFAGKDGGGKLFFGLDAVADVYIGFEYGITNNLNIDLGRSTIPSPGGLLSLELKYAVLHQTSDDSSPIAVTLLGTTGLRLYNTYNAFSDRVSYFGQAIFARKFSSGFSFQISPSIVQDNLPIPNVPGNTEDVFSVSATARFKLSKHMGFIVDYAHPFSSFRNGAGFSDPLGFGIEAVTGGHVFTINISNPKAVSEINYLSNTKSDWSRGQYRIGFTISRMFDFNHKESYK